MSDYLGKQFGNYKLIRLLGKGGFAEVYLGEHIYLKSHAAVKLLYAQLTPEDLERFLAEARLLYKLIHPQIIRILDFGIEKDIPFLVMDFAPNGSLRTCHPHNSQLTIPTVISYVKQIASALKYAHDQKFVHRDVKPDNLLLGQQNEVLLADFGIATVSSSWNPGPQHMAGTAPYMAPEQIKGKPRSASDQYALGAIVYEWLNGATLFNGSYTEIINQHLSVSPPPFKEDIHISPAIENVVRKALAKTPEERFANIQDFAEALEKASISQETKSKRFDDLLFYDPLAGEGEFYTTDEHGEILFLKQNSWLKIWTHIISGNFGGGEHMGLLFYSSSAGEAQFYSTDGCGNIQHLHHHPVWRKSWTHIVPGNFGGSGYTDLFFYDPAAGEGEFYTTDGHGEIHSLTRYTGLTKTWTHIIPGHFGDSPYTSLLFYSSLTGKSEFYSTDSHSNITLLKSHQSWRKSWKCIIPGNFASSKYTDLLFYDPFSGEGEFYTIDEDGNIHLLKKLIGWSKNWTHITPGNFGEGKYTDLLFYSSTVGEGKFYSTDGHGNIQLLHHHPVWRKSWTQVISPVDRT